MPEMYFGTVHCWKGREEHRVPSLQELFCNFVNDLDVGTEYANNLCRKLVRMEEAMKKRAKIRGGVIQLHK